MEKIIEKLTYKSKLLCGVCRYLAKQFGWSVMWTRVISVLVLIANPVVTFLAYIVMAMMVSQKSSQY